MKNIYLPIVGSVVFASVIAFGATPGAAVYPVPPEKMAEFNAKTGGMINPPENGKRLILLDARTKDMATISNFVVAVESQLGMPCATRRAVLGASTAFEVALAEKAKDAGAVVLFYESDKDPVLSVFPEDAISLVNVTPLQNPEYVVYRRRVVKEFWRGVAFAAGGYGNPLQMGSALQPAFSVKELDEVKGVSLTPIQMNSIAMNKAKLGIYSPRPVPYSRAAREGWAPTPTNEVQKALYERFKDPTSRFKKDFGN